MVIARWQDANGSGIEHCRLDRDGSGLRLSGAVAGIRGSREGGFYRIVTDAGFRTREVLVALTGGAGLHLLSDGAGTWQDVSGHPLPALAGCIDVDLAMTPATNTLPILRLACAIGQPVEIKAAYVPLPGAAFQPCRAAQRYTRLARDLWLYESIGTDFSARLRLDADGLVLDYPGLYRRL